MVEKKTYYFMLYAEYFYIDKDWNIKLSELGKGIPECVKSYNEYLKDLRG